MSERAQPAVPRLAEVLAKVAVEPERVGREIDERQPSRVNYALLFTPRSGSTWLVDLLSRQRTFGYPREYLNHNLAPRVAELMQAATIETYIAQLMRKRQSANGVFGIKATYFQIRHAELDVPFETLFPGAFKWLYIRRANLIAQGISLWKATTSRIPHRHASHADRDGVKLEEFDRQLGYDAAAIAEWTRHILAQEEGCERLIVERGLRPMRLLYEDLLELGEAGTLGLFHRAILGAAPMAATVAKGVIERIGTERNSEHEARFRAEQPGIVASLEARRPGLSRS